MNVCNAEALNTRSIASALISLAWLDLRLITKVIHPYIFFSNRNSISQSVVLNLPKSTAFAYVSCAAPVKLPHSMIDFFSLHVTCLAPYQT